MAVAKNKVFIHVDIAQLRMNVGSCCCAVLDADRFFIVLVAEYGFDDVIGIVVMLYEFHIVFNVFEFEVLFKHPINHSIAVKNIFMSIIPEEKSEYTVND